MKNVFLVLVALLLGIPAYAQEVDSGISEDDVEEINEIIDDLLGQDELSDLLSKSTTTNFLHFSLEYANNTFFAGRDIGVDQYSLSPQLSYIHAKGFFVSASVMYFDEFTPKWDNGALSIGYGKRFGKRKNFRWAANYERYFFSNASDNPFSNAVNASIEVSNNKRTLGTELAAGLLFGTDETLQLVSSTYAELNLLTSGSSQLAFRPELRFVIGRQSVQLSRTFFFRGRRITVYRQQDDFGFLNTQLLLPLQYSLGDFEFELGYQLNFPSALEGETNLKTTGTWTLSLSYLFDF
ncbi:conserved exported hypothetical protein [Tenacibaculum litopenaei]|uniref:hypothetical protein n=1 Tax=Tenacibaculum litopenaei TaxID=396016 RepID=UPI0038949B3B